MRKIYIAFDDTDTLDSPGTGHLLTDFLKTLPYETSYITRHQLFVSPDVPYTSHNSSMCSVVTGNLDLPELIRLASGYLEKTFAPGADPGLCIAGADRLVTPERLVAWGYRAKKEVLTKTAAYELAAECGVHLSEHGGTGQGVVGALAAVGLRIGGQDGRVKGRMPVGKGRMTVKELLACTGFERVSAYGQGELPADAVIELTEDRLKAVYQDYQSTVLVVFMDGVYRPIGKSALKIY